MNAVTFFVVCAVCGLCATGIGTLAVVATFALSMPAAIATGALLGLAMALLVLGFAILLCARSSHPDE